MGWTIQFGMAARSTGVVRTTLLVLTLCVVGNVARADWRTDAETGVLYNSNLSNSDRASDEKDDFAWQSDLQLGNGFQLTRDLRLNLAADLREQVWARFDAFNNVAPGGTAGLRHRFGLGRMAPWVLVEDHAAYAFFHDDGRSGFENRFRVRGGFGITERLAVEAAYMFDDFQAKDPFWDLSGNSGSIRLTFDATSSLQVALGYSYREGEVISYALPPRPDIVALASAREPVDSFGTPLYTAYRLRGSTNAVSASVGYTLGKYVSVLVSYEFRHTSSGPLDYENHLVEAKFAFVY
ncbi:MAG: hypothetical protein ABI540_11565 [Spartobacteria bacterium]